MNKLPPQPHKPRYYYYSIHPTETTILIDGTISLGKFIGVVQEMKSDHGYLEEVMALHTEEAFDDPDRCYAEVIHDMSNINKPEK